MVLSAPDVIGALRLLFPHWSDRERVVVLAVDQHLMPVDSGILVVGTKHYARLTGTVLLDWVRRRPQVTGIFLAHNHPSGDVRPSTEDVVLTHQLNSDLRRVGITLLDHFVLTETEHASAWRVAGFDARVG